MQLVIRTIVKLLHTDSYTQSFVIFHSQNPGGRKKRGKRASKPPPPLNPKTEEVNNKYAFLFSSQMCSISKAQPVSKAL